LVNAIHAQYGICNVVCKLVNRRPVIPQNDSWVVSVADMLGGRMDDVVTCSNVVIVDMSVIVDLDVVTSAEEEEVDDDEAAVSEE
jgi:hypothetical protein